MGVRAVITSFLGALAALGCAAACLPGPTAAKVLAPWGADLTSATPNYDTANGDYTPGSQSNFSSNPTPGASHAITPQYHSGDDLAIWNPGSAYTAPEGGQVLYVKVKGCAWNDPQATGYPNNEESAGYPPNKVNFQTLMPTGGGSYSAPYTAAGFPMPWCSDSSNPSDSSAAVNTSTVSTFQPIHLCISQGDTVDFYDIGGYIPSSGSYPNGVPFLVIAGNGSAAADATLNPYVHAETAQSGGTGTYSSSSGDFGVEPNEELMLQVIEGTGDDAYGLCPGGKANEPSPTSNHITCVSDSNPEPGYKSCNGSSTPAKPKGKPHHKHKHKHKHKRHKKRKHVARLAASAPPF